MSEPAKLIEGTWEEILACGTEFAGRHVCLMLLDDQANDAEQAAVNLIPATNGTQPVKDFDVWMACVPHFDGTDEEFAEFEQTIADSRNARRELSREHKA